MARGAPRGNTNALKHGAYTREMRALRHYARALIRGARAAVARRRHAMACIQTAERRQIGGEGRPASRSPPHQRSDSMNFDLAAMGFDETWFERIGGYLSPVRLRRCVLLHLPGHRRQTAWIRVMRTYAEQGKEPPASLTRQGGDPWRDHPWRAMNRRYGRHRWPISTAARSSCLARRWLCFCLYRKPADTTTASALAAIICGALAVGFILMALIPRP